MLDKFAMTTIFLLGMAAPAFADSSSCYEPIAPAATDGNAATEAQLKSTLAEVKDFIKASDDYQTCLLSDLQEQKRKALQSKDKTPLDPSIEADVKAKVAKNQALKEQVGGEYNAAVQAYKAKHP
jgi:hypothetical protein